MFLQFYVSPEKKLMQASSAPQPDLDHQELQKPSKSWGDATSFLFCFETDQSNENCKKMIMMTTSHAYELLGASSPNYNDGGGNCIVHL